MKNSFNKMMAVAFVATVLASCAPEPSPSDFNSANLVGTWNITRHETRDITNDTIMNFTDVPAGTMVAIFNSDGTFSVTALGSGNFATSQFNSENIIILSAPVNPDSDTNVVKHFNGTHLEWSEKLDELSDGGETDYDYLFFQKQ